MFVLDNFSGAERCKNSLCRKRPSPLLQGNMYTWAAGMIHALGTVNFLFDGSQTIHLPSSFISEYFGLGQCTCSGPKGRHDYSPARSEAEGWVGVMNISRAVSPT